VALVAPVVLVVLVAPGVVAILERLELLELMEVVAVPAVPAVSVVTLLQAVMEVQVALSRPPQHPVLPLVLLEQALQVSPAVMEGLAARVALAVLVVQGKMLKEVAVIKIALAARPLMGL
jgi:hypothetical protein